MIFRQKIKKDLLDKNQTSTFKIWGILAKKIFRKFFKTSVINTLQKGDSRYFVKKFQKLFKWTKIQLQFSKSGVFWEKK